MSLSWMWFIINPIQDGLFRDCSRMGGAKRSPLPKICYIYPTMMKLGTVIPYLKRIQKLYESRDTPLDFCWHQHFLPEISKFCYIMKYRYRFHLDTWFLILLTFLESLRIILINVVTILMISAKMATPGFLKIKDFWKKGYDVITSVDKVTNKILLHDSNYNVNMVMWPKFRNSSTSVRKVIITSFDQKNRFFEGWSWFKFNN